LVVTVRLTATTFPAFRAEAEQFGLAAQAGSQQPAEQSGSQQPAEQSGSQQSAAHSGSQQVVQHERHFFALLRAARKSRIGVHFFFIPQQPTSAAQPGSQQATPASQAGSQQAFPASQAGSQQPASQAGSQQLSQQPWCFRFTFSNSPLRPPKRVCFFRTPQQPTSAAQPGSQQPASQAGSQQAFPASQAGSQQPASQAGSQQPASQVGSQHEVQPLQPSILSRSSKPKDWLQTVTPRTSAPRNIIRFIEPHLLCLRITRES